MSCRDNRYFNKLSSISNTLRRNVDLYSDFQILFFSHYLHIVYIINLSCINTLPNNVRNKDNKKLKN